MDQSALEYDRAEVSQYCCDAKVKAIKELKLKKILKIDWQIERSHWGNWGQEGSS